MKKKWNIVGLLLAVFVAMMLLPVKEAAGQTKEAYAVLDGSTLTLYYDTNRPWYASGMRTSSDNEWGQKKDIITKVVFDQSFKDYKPTSCAYWFQGCQNLTEIVGMKEYLNTEDVTDMCCMFGGCKLTSLDLSSFNTAKVTNMSRMFIQSQFTNLNLSSFNTANVTDMSSMFSGCSSLTSLDLSSFNTANVTDMSDMFFDCSGLTSLDLSGFNTANVTNMSYMFSGCSGLTSLDLGSFNTGNVATMSSMFSGCSRLTSLDLSGFNTANVTNMSCMFSGCSGLTSLDLSGFNTGKVTSMWRMFFDCSGLTSLDLSSFNTGKVATMSYMFSGCSSLTSLDLSGFNTANVTNMSCMFSGCSGLTSLDLGSFNTTNVTNMRAMFSGCSGLTSLDLSSFNTAKVTDMSDMFSGCSNLTNLDLSSFNTAKVTNMSRMFSDCNKLKTIFVDDTWNTDKVTSSSHMFYGCNKLYGGKGSSVQQKGVYDKIYYAKIDGGTNNPGYFTKKGEKAWYEKEVFAVLQDCTLTFFVADYLPKDAIDIMSGDLVETNSWQEEVKKVVFDKSFAEHSPITCAGWFSNCTNLTEIVGMREYLNTANVTDMTGMFYNCSGLTSLDLSSFNTANVTNMRSMFSGCSGLTSLDLSSFNTAKVTDMSYMFSGCNELKTIFVEENWNTIFVTKSDMMFAWCSKLRGGKGSTTLLGKMPNKYMAIIDGGSSEGFGLFTKKGDPVWVTKAFAVLYQGALYFYYAKELPDNNIFYDIEIGELEVCPKTFTKVIFDQSFKDYKPTSCASWFHGCKNLTEIVGMKEYLNTEEVTDMSDMFHGCSNLTSLDFNGLNTANVTNMSDMFHGCSNLTSLNFNGLNTANVTNMKAMFYECIGLTSLDLSSFNTANVTNMNGMFYSCFNLTSLDLRSFNTAKVTSMASMFSLCRDRLKSLDLSSFNTANVTDMTGMFYDCTRLKTIFVGKDWNTDKVSNSARMFDICSALCGGAGTKYDKNYIDKSYARIDEGVFKSGYFTKIELAAIAVKDMPKTEYIIGEKLSLDGGTLQITYSNGDNNIINLASAEVSGFVPDKIGEQTLTVKYLDKETSFTVHVAAKTAVSIKVSKLPETKYLEGDNLSLNGGVITVKYNNGESEDIDIAKAEVSGYDSNKAGEQVVTVKYLGKETSYKVYVTAKTAVYMEITKLPKTEYYEGEDLSFDGGVIYVKYNNGTSEEVALAKAATEGYYYHDETTHNVRVNYLGLEISYDVNIKAKYVVSISIYKLPKLSYLEGEELSRAGGVITVQYNNGTSENITFEEAELFGFDSYKLGSQYITVRYHNCETLYEITMHAKSAVSIEVTKLPDAGYHEGEELRLGGGIITVKYNNGTSEEIDIAKAEVWGYDTNKAGRQTIMVRYLGLETSYNVDVKAKQVVSIEITKNPKIDYIQGENLSLDGGMIGVTYDNKAYEELALSSTNISGYDPNKIGEQSVIVEYEGRQTKFTVTVSEKKENNPNDPTPVSEISANSAKIWSSDKTIYVQNPGKEIRIADMSGHLVKTVKATADRMEIQIQKSGIYIVKTGAKTQKVMIK